MTGQRCCVCSNTQTKDPTVSFHRVPRDPASRKKWLEELSLQESDLKPSSRVCSRHFPDGDMKKIPSLSVGIRFGSPIKPGARANRAKGRATEKFIREHSSTPSTTAMSSSRSVTPVLPEGAGSTPSTTAMSSSRSVTPVLPEGAGSTPSSTAMSSSQSVTPVLPEGAGSTQGTSAVLVHTALLARIEVLECENAALRDKTSQRRHFFRIEDIQDDDQMVSFYTGFVSYMVYNAFFEFLGPVVNNLNYWGSKERVTSDRRRSFKLDPKNQLFILLVKLKLNLKLKDLAFRFGLSTSQTSRYITTWICFLYHHMKEIDWMPAVSQVLGTLPTAFREKFPTTYAIIDGSEVFIETPSDLSMQSSTWSQYKHHNTVKFLVACTPNGSICFISPVYVGSISDVELTRVCGFLTEVKDKVGDKPDISIMADKGFTIRDMLKDIGVGLNIPAFLNEKQLSPEDVVKGRKIASLRIHVERAIGRIKTFNILKGTIPISMARLTNQIIFICVFLTNFQPALVPLPKNCSENEVEDFFDQLSDSDTDSDDSEVDSDC